ncbi:SPW repeat protein [Paenacidovorax monticola]|uniref:SPW repeat protein n=1 Tax=Paenacidovorax monticola TaxID=1926868 RepID=A0A7H0HH55_9BURK|nr:SPW repeat protein [Paenacidovorax monticola]MBO9680843.1 SPW repeat protein [Acidovorax sp.]QNP59871.1 SPW repeat protein [Paenacidovorax monticola]
MKQMKHWQDPLNALLGAWLALSPWVLGYQDQMTPTANGVVIGLALIAAALGAIFMPRAWEEWSEGVLGLWMIVSPWVLGFSMHMDAMRNAVVSGIVVLGLALWVVATDKDYQIFHRDSAAH